MAMTPEVSPSSLNSRAAKEGARRLKRVAALGLAALATAGVANVYEANKANEPISPVAHTPSALTQQTSANLAVLNAEASHKTIKVDVQANESVPVLVRRVESINSPALEKAVEQDVTKQALGVGPEGKPELRYDQTVIVPVPEGAQPIMVQSDPNIHVLDGPQG